MLILNLQKQKRGLHLLFKKKKKNLSWAYKCMDVHKLNCINKIVSNKVFNTKLSKKCKQKFSILNPHISKLKGFSPFWICFLVKNISNHILQSGTYSCLENIFLTHQGITKLHSLCGSNQKLLEMILRPIRGLYSKPQLQSIRWIMHLSL